MTMFFDEVCSMSLPKLQIAMKIDHDHHKTYSKYLFEFSKMMAIVFGVTPSMFNFFYNLSLLKASLRILVTQS